MKFNKELINRDSILYMVIIIIILIWGFGFQVCPLIKKILNKQSQISELSTKIIDLNKKKSDLNTVQNAPTAKTTLPIMIFRSSLPTNDFEGAGMELVYKLLKIIGGTGNKITEISMTPTPKAAGAPAGTLNVSLSLDCTYVSIQNMLQRVSTWDYLAEIKNVSIEPLPNDTNKLNAKLSIDLYVDQ